MPLDEEFLEYLGTVDRDVDNWTLFDEQPAKEPDLARKPPNSSAKPDAPAKNDPKSELKQIFKRFYRVPGQIATRVRGIGLGLYIVRSVAKRHGGRAWAESEGPGRGSTFVLQLPIVK